MLSLKFIKALKSYPNYPQKVVDALKDLGPEGLVTPSALEWDEMHVNFKAVLSTWPDIPARASLSAAFEILVLRGKALLESQSSIQKIAADLAAVQQRLKLHQTKRNGWPNWKSSSMRNQRILILRRLIWLVFSVSCCPFNVRCWWYWLPLW